MVKRKPMSSDVGHMVVDRSILSLMDNETGRPANFEIIIYGRSAREMQVVPNEVAAALAHKYPTVTGSLFAVRPAPTPAPTKGGKK